MPISSALTGHLHRPSCAQSQDSNSSGPCPKWDTSQGGGGRACSCSARSSRAPSAHWTPRSFRVVKPLGQAWKDLREEHRAVRMDAQARRGERLGSSGCLGQGRVQGAWGLGQHLEESLVCPVRSSCPTQQGAWIPPHREGSRTIKGGKALEKVRMNS